MHCRDTVLFLHYIFFRFILGLAGFSGLAVIFLLHHVMGVPPDILVRKSPLTLALTM